MKVKFTELDKETQIGRCTIPQAVFVTQNPDDETFEQVVERQEKFLKLSESIKNKLIASETAEKIKAIGEHYKLELLQMAPIARVIRSYYFGEVKLESFADVISRESKINLADAQNIAKYIVDRIINKDAQAPSVVPTVKMTVTQAMEKYPEIKGQILTSTPIEIAGQIVRPTIQNWTRDYFNVVGAGNRDIMKRSSFLYHAKNSKNLNAIDRQKLSNLLKSLDEGFLLKIDINKREIVFDGVATMNRTAMPSGLDMNKKIELPAYQQPTIMARDGEAKSYAKETVTKKELASDTKNNEALIRHVQGNSWDLKSSHFIKRNEFDKNIPKSVDEENIKFSSPQQLPVEKESDLAKPNFGDREPTGGKSLKNLFGRIEPID